MRAYRIGGEEAAKPASASGLKKRARNTTIQRFRGLGFRVSRIRFGRGFLPFRLRAVVGDVVSSEGILKSNVAS